MDAAKWNIIKNLFADAADLPAAEARRRLMKADPDVRREVENLLRAHEQAADFIAAPFPVERGIIAEPDADFVGGEIGDYSIIKKIGAGGMGTVYLAEKIYADFTQKVALKIIKRGMDSEAILRRFAAERKILSGLNHPNIAQMYGGGSSGDCLPFFVMEYVDGVPLNRFFETQDVPLRRRLEIFRQVCAAVECAHQNLVVHRDLKPSNILVNAGGVPKLLDFGIAKLLSGETAEATGTQTHGAMLTPEYASPEQMTGKNITTATDVYSLGVILYEILTHHRPFDVKGKSFDEIVKKVCETDPLAPSSDLSRSREIEPTHAAGRTTESAADECPVHGISASQLKGDLDNIVLKALRKNPAERYGSARELSDDLDRYLRGLPVLARPQTLVYRCEKYVRRHTAGVAAGALVFLSLAGGISVASYQTLIARRERARAERRFDEVRGLAKTVLFDHYERIKNLPGATEARAKLVSDALRYLDALAVESADNAELQRELVAAYRKLGEIQGSNAEGGNLGDETAARENLTKALAIQEQLAAATGDIADLRNLGLIYLSVSDLYELENERPVQAQYVAKGLQIFEKLQTENPNRTQGASDLAKALWTQANIVRLGGDNGGAIEIYKRAAGIYETLGGGEENAARYRRNAALTYKNIGAVYAVEKDFQTALEWYQKALVFDGDNALRAPDNTEARMDLAFTHKSLAQAFHHLGDRVRAVEQYQSAIAIQERIIAADAQNAFAAKSLFKSYTSLAEAYRDTGDFAAADQFYLKCRKMLASVENEKRVLDRLQTADFFWSYGEMLMRKAENAGSKNHGEWAAARENLRQAKNIYQTLENQRILDPAYRENIGKIDRLLTKIGD